MKSLVTVIAFALTGFASGRALAQRPHEKWRGPDAQKCAVVNCSSAAPTAAAPVDNSAEADAQYEKVHKEAVRVWNAATAYTSFSAKREAYLYALELFRQQQGLRDGLQVREAISQLGALEMWTSGIIDDESKNYASALNKLLQAYKDRPDLFSEGNYNYIAAVETRYRGTLRNESANLQDPSVVIPEQVVNNAISDRVFFNSAPGVRDRVRKGFQAVMVRDWKVARAWFADALNLEPDNANLASYIAIIDLPTKKGARPGPPKDSGMNFLGEKLPAVFTYATLKANADVMTTQQVTKALEDILVTHQQTLEQPKP